MRGWEAGESEQVVNGSGERVTQRGKSKMSGLPKAVSSGFEKACHACFPEPPQWLSTASISSHDTAVGMAVITVYARAAIVPRRRPGVHRMAQGVHNLYRRKVCE